MYNSRINAIHTVLCILSVQRQRNYFLSCVSGNAVVLGSTQQLTVSWATQYALVLKNQPKIFLENLTCALLESWILPFQCFKLAF